MPENAFDTTDGATAPGEPALSRRGEWLLYLAAVLFLFLFGWYPGLFNSEDRWAEAAREMLLTGDWLHPAINAEIYFDKPFLGYWLVAAAGKLFGGVHEFALRLPSMLAALAALWATVQLGKKMFGYNVALTAGWLLAGSYGFLYLGRSGEADMENMAAIVLAVLWLYRCREKAGFGSYLVFYAICFAGAMTKGLPSIIVPMVAGGALLLPDKMWLRHLKFSNFAAFVLMLGVYLVPFYLAGTIAPPPFYTWPGEALTALELVWRENIERAIRPFDHKEPFYIYFYEVPRLLLPWVLIFAAALWSYFRRYRTGSKQMRSLGWVVLAVYLLFSISGSRRWYYILPIVPFIALMMGEYLHVTERGVWERRLFVLMRYLVIVVSSLLTLSVLILPLAAYAADLELPWVAYVGTPLTGLAALTLMLLDERAYWRERLAEWLQMPLESAAWVTALTLLVGGALGVLLCTTDQFRTGRPFLTGPLRAAVERVGTDNVVFLLPEAQGVISFYLDQPVARLELVKTHIGSHADTDEQRRREWGRLAAWLSERLDREVLIVSDTKTLRRLGGDLPGTGGRFDWGAPELAEPTLAFETAGKRKLVAWLLEPPARQEGK